MLPFAHNSYCTVTGLRISLHVSSLLAFSKSSDEFLFLISEWKVILSVTFFGIKRVKRQNKKNSIIEVKKYCPRSSKEILVMNRVIMIDFVNVFDVALP